MFKVLILDNLRAVVAKADAVNPRLSVGWLEQTLFADGALIKTHPRQHPAGRSTDRADLPVERGVCDA